MNPQEIVAQGYGCIAERYAEELRPTQAEERERHPAMLFDSLPLGAMVLDLGLWVVARKP